MQDLHVTILELCFSLSSYLVLCVYYLFTVTAISILYSFLIHVSFLQKLVKAKITWIEHLYIL